MATYEEHQRLQIGWLIVLLTLVFTLPVLLIPTVRESMLSVTTIAFTVLLTCGLVFINRQTIRFDAAGIAYRQQPFHRTFRQIPWSEIQQYELKKLSPLKDFGGWGLRSNGRSTGYIIEGDDYLDLRLTGKRRGVALSIKDRAAVDRVLAHYENRMGLV